MEKYLEEQFDVFEDKNYLTKEEDIEEYFEDNGSEYFDCGQGEYEDETSLLCKVGEKFYLVEITADIGSQKQDRGDRLYWVEDITSVTYEEIPKPLPKSENKFQYEAVVTGEQKQALENFMKKNFIEFEVTKNV